MRSIDIRSEPAVRLLSDFLDVRGSEGRERQGTEHFVHGQSNCLSFRMVVADQLVCDQNSSRFSGVRIETWQCTTLSFK
jgi:hypothetical protein